MDPNAIDMGSRGEGGRFLRKRKAGEDVPDPEPDEG